MSQRERREARSLGDVHHIQQYHRHIVSQRWRFACSQIEKISARNSENKGENSPNGTALDTVTGSREEIRSLAYATVW